MWLELIVIVAALEKRAVEDYFDPHLELRNMLEQKGRTYLLTQVHRSFNGICWMHPAEGTAGGSGFRQHVSRAVRDSIHSGAHQE